MIKAIYLPENKSYDFENIIFASRETRIPEGRIFNLIKTGGRWKGWSFDLID